jgi:hypothetical protein
VRIASTDARLELVEVSTDVPDAVFTIPAEPGA